MGSLDGFLEWASWMGSLNAFPWMGLWDGFLEWVSWMGSLNGSLGWVSRMGFLSGSLEHVLWCKHWSLKSTILMICSHKLRSLRYPELRCDLLNLKRLMENSCFDFKG